MEKLKRLFKLKLLLFFVTLSCFSQVNEKSIEVDKVKATSWNGSEWSQGVPDLNTKAIFEADFAISDILNIKDIEIKKGFKVIVKDGGMLKTLNPLTSEQKNNIDFEDGSSIFVVNSKLTPQSSPMSTWTRTNSNVRQYSSMFFSSPVSGQNIWEVTTLNYPSNYISYHYNPLIGPYGIYELNLSGFNLITNPTTYIMQPGKGYVETVGGDGNYAVQGNFQTGIYNQEFSGADNVGPIITPINAGIFNLVGNPFSNFLDADSLLLDINNQNVVSGPIQLWSRTTIASQSISGENIYNNTAASYAMYNVLGGVSSGRQTTDAGESQFNNFVIPNGRIRIGTAFLIKGNNGGNLQFTEDMRTNSNGGNTQMFRSNSEIVNNSTAIVTPPEKHRIWVNLVKGSPSDANYSNAPFRQALVGYAGCASSTGECATNGDTDRVFDAEKNLVPGIKIDVYSLAPTPNLKLAIQGRSLPFNYTDEIQLGYSVVEAGTYTFDVPVADGLFAPNGIRYFIKDNLNSGLISPFPFTFTAVANETSDTRFEIVFLTCSQPIVLSQLSNPLISSTGAPGPRNWVILDQSTGQTAMFTTIAAGASNGTNFQLMSIPGGSNIVNLTYSNPVTPPPGKFFAFGHSYLVQSYIGTNLVSACQYLTPTMIPRMRDCGSTVSLSSGNQQWVLDIGSGNTYFDTLSNTYLSVGSGSTNVTGARYQISTDCNFTASSIIGTIQKVSPTLYTFISVSNLTNAGITIQPGITYFVRASIRNSYGEWLPYGPCCSFIRTFNRVSLQSNTAKVYAPYPNPFTTNFTLDLSSIVSDKVTVKVYDMLGKLIENKEFEVKEANNVIIGDNYNTGMYNVVILDGDELITFKVIKN